MKQKIDNTAIGGFNESVSGDRLLISFFVLMRFLFHKLFGTFHPQLNKNLCISVLSKLGLNKRKRNGLASIKPIETRHILHFRNIVLPSFPSFHR